MSEQRGFTGGENQFLEWTMVRTEQLYKDTGTHYSLKRTNKIHTKNTTTVLKQSKQANILLMTKGDERNFKEPKQMENNAKSWID